MILMQVRGLHAALRFLQCMQKHNTASLLTIPPHANSDFFVSHVPNNKEMPLLHLSIRTRYRGHTLVRTYILCSQPTRFGYGAGASQKELASYICMAIIVSYIYSTIHTNTYTYSLRQKPRGKGRKGGLLLVACACALFMHTLSVKYTVAIHFL